ncbi:hypothetical protein [Deinococcus soli (ex Cha et al. 2016)]|uniref:Uncharacterized protein n=2 Tax=Deinococcus soli (ex Cha et al. 2016) TaxID=1309411 RepID=A0ACC6KKH9_9DEIO|nr:hypothetical protein [Deinococcus soli (ex Cha et al. 2016)]MDR6218716.1 hypothetical protein [Deinococcus soli (ex Cha et al. 2016)]MDR6328513.1 hypothetical protein [Deinococcus soli (ex Cha et al. 2016)]MDR6753124.1 hypothetical protein [Deinococcus soli (ex Cha et al. 2016)]
MKANLVLTPAKHPGRHLTQLSQSLQARAPVVLAFRPALTRPEFSPAG